MFAGLESASKSGILKVLSASTWNKKSTLSRSRSANHLFKVYSVGVIGFFTVMSFTPSNAQYNIADASPVLMEDITQNYSEVNNALFFDQDGYIPKVSLQTQQSDRSTMNGKLVHEVADGETLSTIAEEYGLKTETLMWENGISNAAKIKVGQSLVIPPVNGVTHVVEKGQDLAKIAKAYNVNADNIVKQNQLIADSPLLTGQELFIPDAKPLPAPATPARNANARIASSSRVNAKAGTAALTSGSKIGSSSTATPASGKILIKPTRGAKTQGYHPGHYAIDLADASKPPIWAADSGTVVKVSTGTYGGGYGNHVIIDHGNGIKTLYAHMETVAVSTGDTVSQGDVIGKMGRTGRVFGRTGIHLHFEVIKNGIKQNPQNYF